MRWGCGRVLIVNAEIGLSNNMSSSVAPQKRTRSSLNSPQKYYSSSRLIIVAITIIITIISPVCYYIWLACCRRSLDITINLATDTDLSCMTTQPDVHGCRAHQATTPSNVLKASLLGKSQFSEMTCAIMSRRLSSVQFSHKCFCRNITCRTRTERWKNA
jgi:hypothetical protein